MVHLLLATCSPKTSPAFVGVALKQAQYLLKHHIVTIGLSPGVSQPYQFSVDKPTICDNVAQ